MLYPHARILVFAKAPVPGRVKTRLIPELGASAAATLYERLLESTLRRVADSGLAPVDCWCAPHSAHPLFQHFSNQYEVSLKIQAGADLGDRMGFAAESTLLQSSPIILIGGDCPVLSEQHIRLALEWLDSGCDAVLGPAEDGGYVLLGLNLWSARLFQEIGWGGADVLQVTRRRLESLEWRWRELETLWDVDRPSDLERLKKLEGW